MSKHNHSYIYVYLRKKGKPVKFRCQTLKLTVNVLAWAILAGTAALALIWSLS